MVYACPSHAVLKTLHQWLILVNKLLHNIFIILKYFIYIYIVIELLNGTLISNNTSSIIPPSIIVCQEPKELDGAAIFTL